MPTGILKMAGKICKFIAIFFIVVSFSVFAQGTDPTNTVENNSDGSQTFLHHVPKKVATGKALKTARTASSQMLDLRVVLPSKDKAGLDNFVKELYDPNSPNFHKFISPSLFASMFGASSIDSSIVLRYLRSQGLTVNGQSKNGFIIFAKGPVAKVEAAFKVHINNYKGKDGIAFYSPDVNPTIPPQIAGRVYAVIGMDNVKRYHPHIRRINLVGKNIVKGNVKVASSVSKAVTPLISVPRGFPTSPKTIKPHIGTPTGVAATPGWGSVLLSANRSGIL